jgi:23S rRNA pseudouridine955/2504/2580 synthase
MVRNGLIRVDGAKVKANRRLVTGQILRLPPNLQTAQPKVHRSRPSLVSANLQQQFDGMFLAEGRGWLALNKPSGLAVQGGTSISNHVDGMLQALACKTGERLRLVHRLDKDTSGVLLLAKTLGSARALTEDFRQSRIEKTYLAVVMGLPPESGKIRVPLKKLVGQLGEKMMVDDKGKDATTLFRRVDHAGRKLSLMALRPITGKTHQLRVHMEYLGHPICGDGKYSGAAEHPGDIVSRRLHLHAWQVKLADGKVITAPVAPHIKASIDILGLEPPAESWRF